jgi:hypothetical protein
LYGFMALPEYSKPFSASRVDVRIASVRVSRLLLVAAFVAGALTLVGRPLIGKLSQLV